MSNSLDSLEDQPDGSDVARKKVTVAAILLSLLLLFGGCLACGMFGFVIVNDGLEQIKGNPTVLQEIGDVRRVEVDMEATGELSEEERARNTYVFSVDGTDGKAKVALEIGPQGGKLLRMITQDGREVSLQSTTQESDDSDESDESDESAPVDTDSADDLTV